MKFRVTPRGVLKKDDKILFIEYEDSEGIFYSLPGGNQKIGEDLKTALKREIKEETSLDIESGEVLFVREFILPSSVNEFWKDGIHQIEIIFRCKLLNIDQKETAGSQIDIGMRGIKWLAKEEIINLRVYPAKEIFEIIENKEISYLLN